MFGGLVDYDSDDGSDDDGTPQLRVETHIRAPEVVPAVESVRQIDSSADGQRDVMEPVLETRLGMCEVCSVDGAAKYTCPGCSVRFCSVACSKSHKADTGCTGKRNPAAPVTMADLAASDGTGPSGSSALASDYRFLEDVIRRRESAKRMLTEFGTMVGRPRRPDPRDFAPQRGRGNGRFSGPPRQPERDPALTAAIEASGAGPGVPPDPGRAAILPLLPHRWRKLLEQAKARGVNLLLMPAGMSKHDGNTSRWMADRSAQRRSRRNKRKRDAAASAADAGEGADGSAKKARADGDDDAGSSGSDSDSGDDGGNEADAVEVSAAHVSNEAQAVVPAEADENEMEIDDAGREGDGDVQTGADGPTSASASAAAAAPESRDVTPAPPGSSAGTQQQQGGWNAGPAGAGQSAPSSSQSGWFQPSARGGYGGRGRGRGGMARGGAQFGPRSHLPSQQPLQQAPVPPVGKILWRVELIFPSAAPAASDAAAEEADDCSVGSSSSPAQPQPLVVVVDNVSDKEPLSAALAPYLKAPTSDTVVLASKTQLELRRRLEPYAAADAAAGTTETDASTSSRRLTVRYKAPFPGRGQPASSPPSQEVDASQPLQAILAGRTVVEFPTFSIELD